VSLFRKLFGKSDGRSSSSDVAKERLRVVLIHDRTDVSPELIETLRQEILEVISKHVIIDDAVGIDVSLTQTRGRSELQASIPLLGMRRKARPTSQRTTSSSRASR
jgi:cell division topological specificity factor